MGEIKIIKCKKCLIKIEICVSSRNVYCDSCKKENRRMAFKKFYNKYPERIMVAGRKYRIKNKKNIAKKMKEYELKNKDKIRKRKREYRIKNIEVIKKKRNEFLKNKRCACKEFLLKNNISRAIKHSLDKRNINKNGKSTFKYLNYTPNELKQHLEKQFEPWMNWDNYGNYRCEFWDDNNPSTWSWNIDHIIPQCKFKYESMEDENFKKCWALHNLRPLSAKQNNLKGKSEL